MNHVSLFITIMVLSCKKKSGSLLGDLDLRCFIYIISISGIYNDILHNVKEVNSLGGHLENYICIVLVTMLTHNHPIFLNI